MFDKPHTYRHFKLRESVVQCVARLVAEAYQLHEEQLHYNSTYDACHTNDAIREIMEAAGARLYRTIQAAVLRNGHGFDQPNYSPSKPVQHIGGHLVGAMHKRFYRHPD